MKQLTSQFWLTAGAPDCQDLLKHEMLTRHPELRLAFSRPGLITFKSEQPLTLKVRPESHLAMLSGLSLGGAKTVEEVAALVGRFCLTEGSLAGDAQPEAARLSLRVLAWPTAEEEPPADAEQIDETASRLRHALALPENPNAPELELAVLVPPPARPEFGFFVFARAPGSHSITEKVIPRAEAPSRAYAKLVEALAHFSLTLAPGGSVLELGAAPGGATCALLERGLSVLAVDPAELHAQLAPFAEGRGLVLRHLKKPAQALEAADLTGLPSAPTWLVSDMNVAPPISAQYVLRARSLIKRSLRGALLTLKLNDTAAVDTLPRVLGELERAFGAPPRVAHLPSHRREVVAVFGN